MRKANKTFIQVTKSISKKEKTCERIADESPDEFVQFLRNWLKDRKNKPM